ncbi:MAG: methyltransferase domain-containing protein [Solirubrobacterales bacterium]|nr:methyltransferase domain-containing protein [Solirubrobacterales bacterium]
MGAWTGGARFYDLQVWLERWALDAALDLAAPTADDRLLDVATGTGALLRLLASGYPETREVVGLDASEAMLGRARELPDSWRLMHGDARALPFEQGQFDVVTVCYLLQTLGTETRERVLRELSRVLKVGGRLVTVTPRMPRSGVIGLLASPVVRLAARSSGTFGGIAPLDPRRELAEAGFEIERARDVRFGYPSLCLLAQKKPHEHGRRRPAARDFDSYESFRPAKGSDGHESHLEREDDRPE